MEEIKTRNYPTGFKFRIFQAAILSLPLLLASVSVAGCLLGDLAAEFSDLPQSTIQAFVSFPVIGGMIANVTGGILAPKIGKKNLCLLGIAMAFIGAFSPMFIPNFYGKVAVRVIASLGVGLIQPLSASLIVDCFEGKVANTMMGIQSSMVGAGATPFLKHNYFKIMMYPQSFRKHSSANVEIPVNLCAFRSYKVGKED